MRLDLILFALVVAMCLYGITDRLDAILARLEAMHHVTQQTLTELKK